MNGKKKLLEYLKRKDAHLKKVLGADVVYIDERDLNEVRGWSEKECARLYDRLNPIADLLSWMGCPWCLRGPCDKCGYGARHGNCHQKSSDYRDLINRYNTCVCAFQICDVTDEIDGEAGT